MDQLVQGTNAPRGAKADYAKGHDGQSMPYLPDARTELRSPDQRTELNYFSDRR
jgi:hypothetical protein